MTTSIHRRSSWRRVVGLVAVTVFVSGWPARAEQPQYPHPAILTAWDSHYMPGCGPFPYGQPPPLRRNPDDAGECKEVIVDYGQALEFFNTDAPGTRGGPGHTVTEVNPHGPPRFDSGVVPLGAHTNVPGVSALTPGNYFFFCKINPEMRGKIHVVSGPFGAG
jgi:hypothetical protein